jgi:hypothetical protein
MERKTLLIPPSTEAVEVTSDKRSIVAQRVADLKNSTLQAVAKRERLPQQLFWSLFSSRLDEIKREKERTRRLTEFFERPMSD